MRLTRQAALATALIAGLLAALLAWMFIGQQNKPKPKTPEMVQIPVPVQAIPAGAELEVTMFKLAEHPKDQLTAGVVTDPAELQGRIAVMAMPAGQPVRQEQVQERSARLGMAYALNPGLRGMAVSLDVIGTVGDFIKPLDHVDVLTAFKEDNKVVVRTLVQDVVVLAIGQTVTAPSPQSTTEETSETSKEPPPPRKTETPVTLALTPAQAQIILTADQAGELRLTLRGRDDGTVVALPPANSWTMVGPIPKAQQGQGQSGPQGGASPNMAGAGGPPGATAQFNDVRGQLATAASPGHLPPGTPGAASGGRPAGPQRPKKPYVEVIRGDATEIVVPE